MEAPWKVISPAGVLHYVYDRPGLTALAKEEGIKVFDMEFQVGAPDKNGDQTVGNCTDPEHAGNWTALFRLVWLRHVTTGRIVFVHGNRSAWGASALAADPNLMTCCKDETNFRKLCKNKYNGGRPYAKWEFMKDVPLDLARGCGRGIPRGRQPSRRAVVKREGRTAQHHTPRAGSMADLGPRGSADPGARSGPGRAPPRARQHDRTRAACTCGEAAVGTRGS